MVVMVVMVAPHVVTACLVLRWREQVWPGEGLAIVAVTDPLDSAQAEDD